MLVWLLQLSKHMTESALQLGRSLSSLEASLIRYRLKVSELCVPTRKLGYLEPSDPTQRIRLKEAKDFVQVRVF